MDIKSPEARSRNMAKIKSARTGPEMYIRSLFYRNDLRYRVNFDNIEGKPDLYFSKYKVALFVHGCYWHRHKNCPYAYTPKSNTEFWLKKFEGNEIHDEKVLFDLQSQAIRVLIIWECTIKRMKKSRDLEDQVINIAKEFIITGTESLLEI